MLILTNRIIPSDRARLVRCNWCYKLFYEEDIEYDSATDKEFCPFCGFEGFLMDMTVLD